ncbi:hypothetical protein PENTCL1PPCAC_30048, partial [Pristionchus entomophagus]
LMQMHLWYLALLGLLVGTATAKLQIPAESNESDPDIPTVIEKPPTSESGHAQQRDFNSDELYLNSEEVNREFEEFAESSSEAVPEQKRDGEPNKSLPEADKSPVQESETNPNNDEVVGNDEKEQTPDENSGEDEKKGQLDNSEEIEEESEVEDQSSEEELPSEDPSNADETKEDDEKLTSSEEIEEVPEIEDNHEEERKEKDQEDTESEEEVEEEPEIDESEEKEDAGNDNVGPDEGMSELSVDEEKRVDEVEEEQVKDGEVVESVPEERNVEEGEKEDEDNQETNSEEIEEEGELDDKRSDGDVEQKDETNVTEDNENEDKLDHSEEIEEESEYVDTHSEEKREEDGERNVESEKQAEVDEELKVDEVAQEQVDDGEVVPGVPEEGTMEDEAKDVISSGEESIPVAETPDVVNGADAAVGGDLENETLDESIDNPVVVRVDSGAVETSEIDVRQKLIEEAEKAFAAMMQRQKKDEENPTVEGADIEQVVSDEVNGEKEVSVEDNEVEAASEPESSRDNEAEIVTPVDEEKPMMTHSEIRAAIISEAEKAFKTVMQKIDKKDEAEELLEEPKLDESEEKEIKKLMTNALEQKEEAIVETAEKAEEESIVRDIQEHSSNPIRQKRAAMVDDPTEQPAGASPIELPLETKDVTGKNETLPVAIQKDSPKKETDRQDLAGKKFTDERGWIHYPWKMFPLTKKRFHREKQCGCQVIWIKKVYTRPRPKSKLVLVHSSSINLNKPRRHPCKRRFVRKTAVSHRHRNSGMMRN